MLERPDPLSPEYIAAASNSLAFRRASNISDMALAAAECAAALEAETEDAKAAISLAKTFFHQVRYHIVFDDLHRPNEHVVMGHEGGDWASKHSKYLRLAEESYRRLKMHDVPSRSERFQEWIRRLKQKMMDARKLEELPG